MTIRKAVLLLAFLFSVALSANAAAQSGNGSLRGIVNDEQGAAIPGVTVTATSPQAMAPTVAVTDATGEYRLTNLPPGTYTLTVELPGFSNVRREGIVLRAAANFQVDELVDEGRAASRSRSPCRASRRWSRCRTRRRR